MTSAHRKLSAVLLAAIGTVAGVASAHHGVAWYDYSKTVTVDNAKVTQYDWSNPHCKIYFDVLDEGHHVQHWMAEMHPPENLLAHGWTRSTLHPGDVVAISFRPAKDGTRTALVETVKIPNGIVLQQNYLLLPPGEQMTILQWEKYIRQRSEGSSPSK